MDSTATLIGRFHDISKDALKACLDYANDQIIHHQKEPYRIAKFAHTVYGRACTLEQTTLYAILVFQQKRTPKIERLSFDEFQLKLDPRAFDILCGR